MNYQKKPHWITKIIPIVTVLLGLCFSPFVFVGMFNPLLLFAPLIVGGAYLLLIKAMATISVKREFIRLIIFSALGVIPSALLLLEPVAGSIV